MPPKMCGKCSKIVYPTEELKCLDKVWHKGCFKCSSCNMTLNMKNYKGYDKLPYCNAHYPKSKPTTVADTPEIRRIAENTKIQSNIKYHEEFEKQKGKKITVADDPEVMRVRQNMEIISNVSYHGDKDKRQQMEMARPAEQVEGQGSGEAYDRRSSSSNYAQSAGRPYRRDVGSISEYDPMTGQATGTPYSNRNSAGARQVYDSNVGKDRVDRFSSSGDDDQSQQPPQQQYQPPPAQPQYQPPPPQQQPPQPKAASKGMVCKAMYDYDAADTDEVSFVDGDSIIFCQPIDEGWMEGQVERTGQRGMLPSNYVEIVNK